MTTLSKSLRPLARPHRWKPTQATTGLSRLFSESRPRRQQNIPEFEAEARTSRFNLSRLSPFWTALIVLGAGLTAYGLYDIYATLTMWPSEIRKDLRGGLAAKYKGDLLLSAQYLRRALDTSKKIPLTEFKTLPYLKTSGIAICLAGVLEEDGKVEEAYKVYEDALLQLQHVMDAKPQELKGQEKMRAVALSHKLGEMAHDMHKPREEEEKWLVLSVETILKSVLQAPAGSQADQNGSRHDIQVMVEELALPGWVVQQDIAAPFEALGSFYSRTGNIRFAMPLYLQAVSILIPPPPQECSPENKCRGAQMMGNIADLILQSGTSPELIQQAESWANKGLEVASVVRNSSRAKHDVCEIAYAFMLFNLGRIREISKDYGKAKELFTASLEQSKAIGLEEGIEHAEDGLRSLGSDQNTALPSIKPTHGGVQKDIS
ncbi:uncharacterized protein LACBIDRAFT_297524 [Laccaria bicolor S238N-H82]|uniref:Predicted protein n=1 Tax=Laccaria bicolor (strain S238N-H82 / ATCC MYA-4686) TaxID=486041 RepID=B0DBE1_LACBS|nr:uncharacterized protein LACBIDRAFT_297524 [Laccaria bicolor S238N-H82]EDR07975.1 predicted protein [Laccaria bicolor S238N-H82]|eukprot:XP_001881045.1 predicted protein [Laccaria bicolor S238N-H82]